MNTMRKIIWGHVYITWDFSEHLLVSFACCNGLSLRGFNTNLVEAEGQCKQSKSEKV